MYDIIWINGTYGIGKTTIAMKLVESISGKDIQFLDSDYYYHELGKENIYKIISGGTTPQNNLNFLNYFREVIEQHLKLHNKPLIVAMALKKKNVKNNFLISLSIKILKFFMLSSWQSQKLLKNE